MILLRFGVTQNLKTGGIGFVCSDTVFSNFGIVDGALVITDAGWRGIFNEPIKKGWFKPSVLDKFFARRVKILDADDYSEMISAYSLANNIHEAFFGIDAISKQDPCLFRKAGTAIADVEVCHIFSVAPKLADDEITQPALEDPQKFAMENLQHLYHIEPDDDNVAAAVKLLRLLHAPAGGVS